MNSFHERLQAAKKVQRELLAKNHNDVWNLVDPAAEERKSKREQEKRQRDRDKAQRKLEDDRRREQNTREIKARKEYTQQRKRNEPVLKLRAGGPDLTGKVLTQINRNTWVYLSPTADVEATRKKIEDRHKNLDDRYRHNSGKSDLSY